MPDKKSLSFLLLGCVALFFSPRVATACSCGPRPTVLDAYDRAEVVVVARVLAVEKADEKSAKAGGYGGVISTTMVVEKIYKGNLKVGDEMTFAQGGGADCIWTFDERDVGRQYLFYPFTAGKQNPRVWVAGGCGRGGGLDNVTEDLLYLDRLDKVRGKTRISGNVGFERGGAPGVEGLKIRISGGKKSYEVETDKNGVYEIYDLPAGEYLIEPEVPFGWKVDYYYLRYSPNFSGDQDKELPKKIPILLQQKKHASLDLHFEIDNAIRGRVYDPTGRPMKDVCIQALPVEDVEDKTYIADCTDQGGNFSITEIQPGDYVLAINKSGKLSSKEPFKTFYYPDVAERKKATVITIVAGEYRDNVNVHVPRLEETITVEGVFLYSDGKAVADEDVEFKAEGEGADVEGDARATTDAQGRFSVRILKGLKGQLYGRMYTYVGEFENCPKLDAVLSKMGKSHSGELKTPAVSVQADNNIYNLELKYPFPGCKKAKTD